MHESFENVPKVHWQYIEDINRLMLFPNCNIEISTTGFQECVYIGGVGIIMEGEVTLAGSGDLGTQVIEYEGRFIKVTEAHDRLIATPNLNDLPYEMTLSKWKPKAFLLDLNYISTNYSQNEGDNISSRLSCIASRFNLPVTEISH